jgi:hypothetical protein
MPRFRPLPPEQVNELTRHRTNRVVDLTEQKAWVQQALAESEGWGEIELEVGDNTRAIKRRTTIAGKESGKIVKWHRRSDPQRLIFHVADVTPVRKRARRVSK